MNDATLTRVDLKVKIQSLDDESKNLTLQLENLKNELDRLCYLDENWNNIAGISDKVEIQEKMKGKFHSYIQLNHKLDTKSLLSVIIKNENREMTWREIFKIFKLIKPNIAESTVRVSLSQINKNSKYPVKLIQKDNEFKYVYEEKDR